MSNLANHAELEAEASRLWITANELYNEARLAEAAAVQTAPDLRAAYNQAVSDYFDALRAAAQSFEAYRAAKRAALA